MRRRCERALLVGVGVVACLLVAAAADFLRLDRCLDLGGMWNRELERCRGELVASTRVPLRSEQDVTRLFDALLALAREEGLVAQVGRKVPVDRSAPFRMVFSKGREEVLYVDGSLRELSAQVELRGATAFENPDAFAARLRLHLTTYLARP